MFCIFFLLKNLLHENQSDHPTLILDTSVECLKNLMSFIYYGMVPPEENKEFHELAAKLRLQGANGKYGFWSYQYWSEDDQLLQVMSK